MEEWGLSKANNIDYYMLNSGRMLAGLRGFFFNIRLNYKIYIY